MIRVQAKNSTKVKKGGEKKREVDKIGNKGGYNWGNNLKGKGRTSFSLVLSTIVQNSPE